MSHIISGGIGYWDTVVDADLKIRDADLRNSYGENLEQASVSTAIRYGIKPRIQGCPRGSVHMGVQNIRFYKKK